MLSKEGSECVGQAGRGWDAVERVRDGEDVGRARGRDTELQAEPSWG